jgi:hypothetical protein
LPAELFRPADSKPPVPTELADDLPENRPAALVPLGVERGPELRGKEPVVVAADLAAQRLLLVGEVQVHVVQGLGSEPE